MDFFNLRDDFIYEYIGEVVSQPSFAKRMREYAEEGIRHFYFMMLQKDEVRFEYDLFITVSPLTFLATFLTSSSSTQRKRVGLVGLRITVAIRIVM